MQYVGFIIIQFLQNKFPLRLNGNIITETDQQKIQFV
jgi:hypothetical protein